MSIRPIKKAVVFVLFHLIFKRMILRNYELRMSSAINGDGKYPDEWYWADKLCCDYGFFVRR